MKKIEFSAEIQVMEFPQTHILFEPPTRPALVNCVAQKNEFNVLCISIFSEDGDIKNITSGTAKRALTYPVKFNNGFISRSSLESLVRRAKRRFSGKKSASKIRRAVKRLAIFQKIERGQSDE